MLVVAVAVSVTVACRGERPFSRPAAGASRDRLLYAKDLIANEVTAFRIEEDASLTPVLSFALSPMPSELLAHPAGHVLLGQLDAGIASFVRDADGRLRAAAGSPFAAAEGSGFLLLERSGSHAYWITTAPPRACSFVVDVNTGRLTPTADSPLVLAASVEAVALDPTTRFLYLAGHAMGIDAPRALTALAPTAVGGLAPVRGLAVPLPGELRALVVHPSGRFLYTVHGGFSGRLLAFAIDSASGMLSPVAGSPFDAGANAGRAFFEPLGRFLYVRGDDGFHGFAIDAAGALRVVSGAPFVPRALNASRVVDPAGGSAYFALSPEASGIGRMRIVESGALELAPGPPMGPGKQWQLLGILPPPGGRPPHAELPAHDSALVAGPPLDPRNPLGIEHPTVAQLAVFLEHADWRKRYYAATLLGQREDDIADALPALLKTLADSDEEVLRAGIYAVGEIGYRAGAAVPRLVLLLKHERSDVREAAAQALGRIGGPAARDAVPTLIEMSAADASAGVRRAVTQAMGQLTAEAAFGSRVGNDVATASDASVSALVGVLEADSPQARSAAVASLQRLGPAARAAVPPLIRALDDPRAEVRQAAAEVLGAIGPAAAVAVPALLGSTEDGDARVRGAAVAALRRLRRVVPSPSPTVGQ